MNCKNELNLEKLCVEHVRAGQICTRKLILDDICAQKIEVKNLSAENEIVNNICCSGVIKAAEVDSLKSVSNDLCAQNATLTKACINELTVGTINYCEKYRAAVTNSADSVYNLGSSIDWDVVIDDPNSNVSLAPFKYTAPVSGYYLLSFHIKSNNLLGAGTIIGIPLGIQSVLVNGNLLRRETVPYLSFSADQSSSLTSLTLLNAGDIVTMKYEVFFVDPISGLTSFVGTVNLEANGALQGESGFTIHYLSSLNCTPGAACVPCAPVTIGCQPFTTPCQPSAALVK
jgi:hypothetical protein